MNFKTSRQLIARVSNELNSYVDAGHIDSGDFYRWIKEVCSELNIPAFAPVHTVISLNGNYKVAVPEDLYQIWGVWKYATKTEQTPDVEHYQGQNRWLVFKDQCIEKESDCPIIYKEDPDIVVTKWYIKESGESRTIKYKNEGPIKLVNYNISSCVPGSPAVTNTSSNVASMDGNHFYFNFTEGSVYLQYFTMPKDETGLPMIPDVVEIERAIEAYIYYKAFRQLYYGTTMDVYRKFQDAKLEYREFFDKAKTWIKFPSFAEVMEISRSNKKRLQLFELRSAR
jgi:hypothetical protein